ncbi:MAG: hypothetical protein Q4C76_02110 [Bacillota bacterium]|nr:hypothetical protein [Bacillota bacterium]
MAHSFFNLHHYTAAAKHDGVTFEKNTDSASGEIFYTLGTPEKKVLIMFNVVGTISQITNSSNWFEKRCYGRFKNLEWVVFLCYDTDNYTPNISKFYEGDWKELCKTISKHRSCSIIDLAAQADIEDIMLLDEDNIFKFLEMPPIPIPAGSKGKMKMKKLFRAKGRGCAYHEGNRAEPLINALDFDKIISSSPVPLSQIELKCFTSFSN